jgi:DNA-binding CsgD family transcriptional regulator/PAS domain-containing protein
MISSQEHWLAVGDLFTSAALDGDWPGALGALADACGAGYGQLVGVGADRAVPFNWMSRGDPSAVARFAAIGGGDPAVNPRVRVGITASILASWHEAQCSGEAIQRRNPVYADFCRELEMSCGSQTNVLREDGMVIGLAVLRSERQGVPQAEERRAFEALTGSVRSAVRMQIALEGQGSRLIAGALDAVRIAAFICDASGAVRAHTAAAEEALGRGVLRLRGRRLAAGSPDEARALEAAVAGATRAPAGPGLPALTTLVLRASDGTSVVEVVDIVRLPSRPYAFGFEPRAMVVVRSTSHRSDDLVTILGLAFKLTPAEADIAVRLVEGQSREAIALARGATIETVRGQIKTVFAKLDVRREGELTARIGALR